MKTLTIRRLSFGSVFKISAIGFGCILSPLTIVIGVLSYLGIEGFTISFNGQETLGPMILVHTAGMAALLPVWFGFCFGGIIFLGQLIYSRFRPIDIKYRIDQPKP